MNGMFCMKKLILVLKPETVTSGICAVIKKIQAVGIEVYLLNHCEEIPKQQEALYVMDCGESARQLKKSGLAVLGFTKGNWKEFTGIDYIVEDLEAVDVVYLDRIYRRYHQIPWEILETKRCIVRETIVQDVDDFFEIYKEEGIATYIEGLHSTREEEKHYIREYIEKAYRYFEFGVWTILWKETGEIIGRAGFSVREGYELPDLGFVIALPWQRKGIAFEICDAILQYGKEEYEFERVQALVMPDNVPSLALCHKLGFKECEVVTEKQNKYQLLTREL